MSGLAGLLYARDILRAHTNPSRLSWWVMTFVNAGLGVWWATRWRMSNASAPQLEPDLLAG